ncbi:hypothetical protein BGX23_004050 [Mortierella sp. AD031]|nr:hypothetical protein BGX23_004050 [Mortierella sp. AD031]KAG0220287.1 hypothetical protein BGX33_003547 [Mortierella sp. NVP41]
MNNNTQNQTSWQPSAQENRPDRVHSHTVAHSTHAFCETFDQATRDLEQESKANSKKTMAAGTGTGYHGHSHSSSRENSQIEDPEQALREANSAVQLDRDVQQSRRGTDDAKQKGAGVRDGSWSNNPNELPYVE